MKLVLGCMIGGLVISILVIVISLYRWLGEDVTKGMEKEFEEAEREAEGKE